ncbi:hypothetical protein E4T45_11758 [Aureobasidium sp. EXF-8846]|nr:hypothetical protein E4T45_11758 [Aureobasidium sp. EXF-8846]
MQLKGLHYRQSCPGGAYYVCQNGFRGCCSIDPCNPGASCPDITTSSIATQKSSLTTTPTTTTTTTTTTTPSSTASVTPSTVYTSSPKAESSSSTTTSSTSALPTATSLTCPAANMTSYVDDNKVQYAIRCNADNSYASFNSTSVSTGGFGKCFPACDNFTACAGFTFVGTDSGTCYLKSNLPEDGYSSTAGSNYVTVALLNRDAQVDPPADALPTDSSDSSKGSKGAPIGAIIGGVIGGLALIILLALLIFFCMRRKRRRREEIRSATQSFPQSPLEPQPKADSPFAALGGELRQPFSESNANLDIEGFYRGHTMTTPKHTLLDESQLAREDSANAFLATKYDKPAPTPAVYTPIGPSEVEGRPVYPSASVEPAPVEMDASPIMAPKTPMSPQVNESPVLGRYASNAYHGQSSLAEDVRRRQHSRHIMSWNNYDDKSVISPPSSMTMSPRIGSPDLKKFDCK